MAAPLLATKLHMPTGPARMVRREENLARMRPTLAAKGQLILLCAPAGYGKTMLASAFLQEAQLPFGWLSLDEGDNDAARFLRYLVAALQQAGIPTPDNVAYMTDNPSPDTLPALLAALLNAISAQPGKLALALDDYHLIRSNTVCDIVLFLVENLPPNLLLLLLTREDPKLPLSRLRVQHRLTEIRLQQLRFTPAETTAFFAHTMALTMEAPAVNQVAERTEGWAAGLQLAALMLQGQDEEHMARSLDRFNGTHHYIIDYMIEEVLHRQNPQIRDFLVHTCVLERMNAALCDELTGRSDGAALLRRLEQTNLFLLSLDDAREWYRYHPLFADSLRLELSAEEEQNLLTKAARWMQRNGYSFEAVQYAFRTNDDRLRLEMLEGFTQDAFHHAQLGALLQWCERLPFALVAGSEVLSVRKAIALFATGRAQEATEHIRALGESFAAGASRHNRGLLLCVQALVAGYTGGDAEEPARQALELLEPWDPIARTSMLNTLGKARLMQGKTQDALTILQSAYQAGLKMGYTLIATLALMNHCNCLNSLGRNEEACHNVEEYLDGMRRTHGRLLPLSGIADVTLAKLLYDRDEVDRALPLLEQGVRLCRSISYHWLASGAAHADILFAAGQQEAALRMLESCDGLAEAIAHTRLLLQLDRPQEAWQRAEPIRQALESPMALHREQAGIAMARLLLSRGEHDAARRLLEPIGTTAAVGGRLRARICTELLLAEASLQSGNRALATEHWNLALMLAAPQGYARLFLEEGIFLPRLLPLAAVKDAATLALLDRLRSQNTVQPSTPGRSAAIPLEYGEKLSARELDILRLISQGNSNAQIAQSLFISPNTAQWHTANLYGKLGVRSRTQAVLKAQALRII